MASWKTVRLGDILTESKVKSPTPNIEKRIRVLLNAKGVIKRPVKKETKGATKYFLRTKSQFIYGKQNIHKGAFGIIPDELDGFESTSDLPSFNLSDRCLPLWVDYYLKQGDFYLSLLSIARGAATKRVQPKELLELKIPLPSIDEQMKIIEGFKNIETEDRELKQELTNQQTLLKKLRQQILQEAIEGKLTEEFRMKNEEQLRIWNDELRQATDPETIRNLKLKISQCSESTASLLSCIKAEKEQLIKDKKIKTQKNLPPITDEEKPFDLPDGWIWCRLEDTLNQLLGGYAFKSPLFKKSGDKQVLRLGNIRPYQLRLDEKPVFIDQKVAEDGFKALLKVNDLLITMTGTRGKRDYCYSVLLTEEDFQDRILYLNQRVGCFRFNRCVFSRYYDYCLKCDTLLDSIFDSSTGAANQANIGSTALRSWVVPFPPLEEQKTIVTKVESLFAICDQLEARITSNQTHAEQLMQAVLKEAFENINDNEVLL